MEKEEFQMKRQIVIDTRKALTRKDLISVRQKVLAKFGQEEQSGGDDLDLRYRIVQQRCTNCQII